MTDESVDLGSGPLADLVPPLGEEVGREDVERVLWRLTGWSVDQGPTDEFLAVVDRYAAGQRGLEGTTGVTSGCPRCPDLEHRVTVAEGRADELADEVRALRQELTATTTALSGSQALRDDLRRELDAAVEQLQGVWDELRDDERTGLALPEDLSRLPQALHELLMAHRLHAHQLAEKVASLELGNRALDESVTELRDALAAAPPSVTSARMATLAEELAAVQRELEAAEERAQEARQARDEAEVAGAELDAQLRGLQAKAFEADAARQAAQDQMRRQAIQLAELTRLREEEHADLVRYRDEALELRDRLAEVTSAVPSAPTVSAGQAALEVTERVTSTMLGQTLAELEERMVRVLQWCRTTQHIREGLHVAQLLGVDLVSSLRFEGNTPLAENLRIEGNPYVADAFDSKVEPPVVRLDPVTLDDLKELARQLLQEAGRPRSGSKVTEVPEGTPDARPCTRCHRVLTLDSYHRDKRQKDGHKGRCKDCESELTRVTREAAGTEVAPEPETP